MSRKKARRVRRAVLGLAMWTALASPVLGEEGAADSSRPFVESIDSPNFGSSEIQRLGGALGIAIGHPLDPRRIDEGLRDLFGKGEVQALFVETSPGEHGVQVHLKGERVRLLRQLVFHNVDPDILSEAQRKSDIKEGQATSLRSFALLRERLRAGYESRGYNFADIQIEVHDLPDSKQADVDVTVTPNQPTLVSKIQVLGGTPAENQALLPMVKLRNGERFSQERLDESIETINKYLRANQYPTSKVEDTHLQYSPNRLNVTVQLMVRMGKRYQFQFTGNTTLSEVALREWLTPELLSQSDATEKVAALVESKYRELGFYFCKVQPETIVDDFDKVNVIRFRITEGPRVHIDRVEFSGGEELGPSLVGLFFDSAPGVLGRHVYSEQDVPEALREMTKRLSAMGFQQPILSGPKTVFSEDHKGVQLFFDADLGPRTLVSAFDASGSTKLTPGELASLVPLKPGDPLDREKVREGRAAILAKLHAMGYNDAKFADETEVEISHDDRRAVIPIKVVEGPKYHVGTVRLEGNQKTHPEVILREMKVREGDPYDVAKVKHSEQDIALLGLFSRVEIVSETDPADPLKKNLHIIVHETEPGLGEVGLGAVYEDPRLRVRGLAALSYRNLMGLNQTVTWRNTLSLPLTGSTGPLPFVEYGSTLGYRAPRPFNLPFDFSVQAGVTQYEVSVIGPTLETQTQITTLVERSLTDKLALRYRLFRLERDKTTVLSPQSVYLNTIGSTGPGLVLDNRDDAFNPRHGSYHTLDLELASPLLLSQDNTSFAMAISRNSFYIPLVAPFRLILFAGFGGAHSFFAGQGLPLVRLVNDLALGGQTSIRGFTVKRFTPIGESITDTTTASTIAQRIQDAAYYNFRGEINVPLFSEVSAAVFMDSGQIFSNYTSYLRHDSIGIGMRYKTPVGPVVVDIAQGLGPDKEAVKFYFTMGTL